MVWTANFLKVWWSVLFSKTSRVLCAIYPIYYYGPILWPCGASRDGPTCWSSHHPMLKMHDVGTMMRLPSMAMDTGIWLAVTDPCVTLQSTEV
jgi:hypothetical protein